MPDPVSDHITTTPSQPGQPYDAASDSADTGRWVKLHGGEADIHTGRLGNGGRADNWPSDGKWVQT